jgi:hypothetical protein
MFLLTRDFSWCANYMPEESLVYGNLMERPVDADTPLGDAFKNTGEDFNVLGILGRYTRLVVELGCPPYQIACACHRCIEVPDLRLLHQYRPAVFRTGGYATRIAYRFLARRKLRKFTASRHIPAARFTLVNHRNDLISSTEQT